MSDEGWRTDTAERPAVRVPPTPPAETHPADTPPADTPPAETSPAETHPGPAAPAPAARPTPAPRPAPAPVEGTTTPPPGAPDRPVRRPAREPAPAWLAWLVVAAVLVATAFVGAYLVVRDPGDTATDPGPARADASAGDDRADESPADEPSPDATTPEEPAEEQPSEAPAGDSVDVTASATVTVPRAAPSNNDVTGELVSFAGANMLDGDVTTCWRMAGDGSGSTLTFTFDSPVTLTRVGLVNGYTKVSVDDTGQAWDWYHGNRRVVSAEWVVGDQTFPQSFTDTAELQGLDIAPTETTTVELRLTEVTTPGPPPIGRDYTAISDVRFSGSR